MVSNVDIAQIYRASVLTDGVTPAPAANAHPKLSATGRVIVFDTLAGAAYNPLAPPTPNSLRQVIGITQQPQLSIADINVGTGIVGLPGGEWFVRLYNAGPGSFVPSKVQSTNPQFGITFGECTEGYAVPPGGSCGVAVILTPSVEGPISGRDQDLRERFRRHHRAVQDHRRRRLACVDGRPGQLPPLRDVEGRRVE